MRLDAVQRRHARREFVRTHHPDLGGEPEAFIAGLAWFEAHDHRPDPVVVVRRPRGLAGWCRHVVGVAHRRVRPPAPRAR